MSALVTEPRSKDEQTAFNLGRWVELLADRSLGKLEGRVETDRHGRIIMSPPPAPRHGRFQSKICSLLGRLMTDGEVVTECPISTADGVKAADVAWASEECWDELGNRAYFIRCPEICVEVVSPGNTEEETQEKTALYFDAGAREMWVCGMFGQMTFFGPVSTRLEISRLCPEFPQEI